MLSRALLLDKKASEARFDEKILAVIRVQPGYMLNGMPTVKLIAEAGVFRTYRNLGSFNETPSEENSFVGV